MSDLHLKNVFKKGQSFEKVKGIISEGWSNSDSKDLDLDEFFEDRFSQISYFGTIETGTPTTSRRENDSFCFKDDDEGFIQVLDKKRGGKKWKETHGNKHRKDYDYYDKAKYERSKKQDHGTGSYSKNREKTTTLVYEVKNKADKNKDSATKGSVAKIIVPVQQTKSPLVNSSPKPTPYFPPLSSNSESKPTQTVSSSSTTTKPKGKALSLKSPSLEIGTIKTSTVREIARKYFDKKLEKDIFEHVSSLTEESNKMMPYRMVVHSRIDYCLKKLFTGKSLIMKKKFKNN